MSVFPLFPFFSLSRVHELLLCPQKKKWGNTTVATTSKRAKRLRKEDVAARAGHRRRRRAPVSIEQSEEARGAVEDKETAATGDGTIGSARERWTRYARRIRPHAMREGERKRGDARAIRQRER